MSLNIRYLGIQPYLTVWDNMKQFTQSRSPETPDELWLLQHPPVFTQGQAGKAEHVLNPGQIPLVKTDRGGQVTYHGPGQLMAYVLLNLSRRKLGIRTLVTQLEQTLVELLGTMDIKASTQCSAPGVYVDDAKIASVGLRVRHGCSYHGIALNIDMDLQPFSGINPCGYKQLSITQISHYNSEVTVESVAPLFVKYFLTHFET